jgi:hypothetical protein
LALAEVKSSEAPQCLQVMALASLPSLQAGQNFVKD